MKSLSDYRVAAGGQQCDNSLTKVSHLVESPAGGGGSIASKLVALEDGEGELLGSENGSDY
jgi:Na+-transporting NADH:ubiquinone oxidoreductase subunit NqrF